MTRESSGSVLTRRQALAGLSLLATRGAHAQGAANYPTRPVSLIVPYAAGGGLDLVARLLARQLSERTGQSFFVENRLGAGGVIAANSVAKAAADGYTLLVGSSTQLAIQVTLHKKLPYDPAADFVPIALVASAPFVLIVNPSLQVHTAGDLVALAKKQPGQLLFGSSGAGSPPHLYMELLQTMTGTKLTHIPYKGTAEAIIEVVSGRVPVLMSDVAPAAPLIAAGKVRALGVSSTTRVAILPDVPPIAANGVPGFDAVAWIMAVAPAATPPTAVATLHADFKTIVAAPDTQQAFVKLGVIPLDTPPVPTLRTFVKSEIVRWGKVVEHAGLAGSQ